MPSPAVRQVNQVEATIRISTKNEAAASNNSNVLMKGGGGGRGGSSGPHVVSAAAALFVTSMITAMAVGQLKVGEMVGGTGGGVYAPAASSTLLLDGSSAGCHLLEDLEDLHPDLAQVPVFDLVLIGCCMWQWRAQDFS